MILPLCLLALALALTGCAAGDSAAPEASCAQLADAVQKAAPFQELTDMTEKYMEKYLLIEAADLEEWIMRRDATRATPEMVLFLRVKPEADLAAIQKSVSEFHDEQILLYRDYQPDQLFKLENARVLTKGRTLALIVSPDAEKTNAALGGGWQ